MKIEFTAYARARQGTGESRRMRRDGKVPGVVYGAGRDAQMIELDQRALLRQLRTEAFHASILDMTLDGAQERVLLRDVQMHPWKQEVLHVDFQRIAKDRKIHMKVPLHFVNEASCPGVKAGGVISHVMTDVDVQCLPDDLPEFIEVDLGNLALGHTVHAGDLGLPEGVELVPKMRTENPAIVLVQVPRQAAAEEAAVATTEITSEKPGESKDAKKEGAKKD